MKLARGLSALLIAGLVIGAVGCSKDDDKKDDTTGPQTTLFEQVVQVGNDYYGSGTKNISGDVLWEEMNDSNIGPTLFIIDWRRTDAYTAGHIEGAHDFNFTDTNLLEEIATIPEGAKVVNYCYSGQSASQATAALNLMGYDAYNLLYGACGWEEKSPWMTLDPAGYDLETSANEMPAPSGNYPELATTKTDVNEAIAELVYNYFQSGLQTVNSEDVFMGQNGFENAYVINFFPEANYLAGHVPGAYDWNSADPTFKSFDMDALKYLPTDRKIVVYCFTGQTSSQIACFLNVLGYDAYTMQFGMNGVTDNADVLGGHTYHPPSQNYPWVTD